MASSQSERIKLLREGFIHLRNDGKSISEIADHFHVSTVTVYSNLQVIADANGVTRESLLYVVHKPHELKNGRVTFFKETVKPEELKKNFSNIRNDVDNIIELIDTILDMHKEIKR